VRFGEVMDGTVYATSWRGCGCAGVRACEGSVGACSGTVGASWCQLTPLV